MTNYLENNTKFQDNIIETNVHRSLDKKQTHFREKNRPSITVSNSRAGILVQWNWNSDKINKK
jgi:hypothetical protein